MSKVLIDLKKVMHPEENALTSGMFPTIWCSGCSIGMNMQAIARGLQKGKLDLDKDVVVISGIGCTGRASGYLDIDGFHTTHGRAIPFAVGVKMSNPDLKVIVFSGDGDLFSIGGNHFIHAARRNVPITVICNNNATYGLTGGQASATSFVGTKTPSTHGTVRDHPFNLVDLAISSGAGFVARTTSSHFIKMPNLIKEAVLHDGFSFIDLISGCPALYGKRNGYPTGDFMTRNFLDASVDVKRSPDNSHLLYENTEVQFDPVKAYTKIPVGIFTNNH